MTRPIALALAAMLALGPALASGSASARRPPLGQGGALGFANADAVPGRGPRDLGAARAEGRGQALSAPPRRSLPAEVLAGLEPRRRPGAARGRFSSTSLPHRDFPSQPLLAEALELAQASLELERGNGARHMVQLLGEVRGRLSVPANQARVGQLAGIVGALYEAAAPRHERAWPAIRHTVLAHTTRWLEQTGKTPAPGP